MEQITKQDALDYCLENPDGLSVDELVARFPQYGAELRPLVGFSTILRGAAPPLPSEARRAAMKQRLLQGVPPQRAMPAPPRVAPWRLFAQQLAGQWMRRPIWAAGVVALVLLLAVGGRAAAAALPDSPLYGAKLGVENVLLAFSPAGADHAQGHLDSANRRLGDMDSMRQAGKFAQAAPAISNYDQHLDAAVSDWRRLSGPPQLHVTEALYVSSVAAKHTFANIDGAVADLPPEAQASAQAAIRQVDSLNAETTRALVAAGVDPQNLLLSDSPDLVRTLQEAHLDPSALQLALAPPATATAAQQAVGATPLAPTAAGATAPSTAAAGGPSPPAPPAAETATPAQAVAQGGPPATVTHTPGAGITARPIPPLPPGPAATGAPPAATGAPLVAPPPTVTSAIAPPATPTRFVAAATATRPPPTVASSPATPTSVAPPAQATVARTTPQPAPPSHTPQPPPPSHTPRPAPSDTPVAPTAIVPPSQTPVGAPPTAVGPTAVVPPSDTPVPPTAVVPPTDTPVPPTEEPRPSRTPGPPPSHTPRPAPSDTPVPPPSDTPVPPTSTPLPTETPVPPTETPVPTETPDPNVCALRVTQVRVQCNAPQCLDWTATVDNAGQGPVQAAWSAALQIKQRTGPFHTVATTHGVAIFPPGGGQVGDQICYSYPPDTTRVKVVFTVSGATDACGAQGSSNAIAPCQ